MMLLGLVIHSAAAYTSNPDRTAWPFQDPHNYVAFDLLALFIHIFRMPVFFVMAGFFAALLYERDGARGFVRNRTRRVLLPLLVFLPTVMPLVGLGFVFALWRVGAQMPGADLPRPSLLRLPILGHLWFLYDLLIFYAATVVLMPLIAEDPNARSRLDASRLHYRRDAHVGRRRPRGRDDTAAAARG